jgi:hypothetical protein
MMPEPLSAFRRILQNIEFTVPYYEESTASRSAFRPEWTDPETGEEDGADVLVDFRFGYLKQANEVLQFASGKLEIEGYPCAGTTSFVLPESLSPELHAQIMALLEDYVSGVRGPAADIVRHLVIAAITNQAGRSWRSKVGVLCQILDHYGIAAPGHREPAKKPPENWVSAFQADEERVEDAIRKSIQVCRRRLTAHFAESFPNLSRPTKNPL